MWEDVCRSWSARFSLPLAPSAASRCPALTQDTQLEIFGLFPHGIGCDAGVVASTRQVGLDDLQKGSIWRNVVGVSSGQGLAIFEPRDLGLWVACRQRREAGKTVQQDLNRLQQRSEGAPGRGTGHGFSISVQRPMQQGKTQKQPPGLARAFTQVA